MHKIMTSELRQKRLQTVLTFQICFIFHYNLSVIYSEEKNIHLLLWPNAFLNIYLSDMSR
jgi:hypothetical protein